MDHSTARALLAGFVALTLAASPTIAPALAAECQGTDLIQHFRTSEPDFVAKLDAEAAATPYGRGKLFRLEHAGVAPSYLFGTVHAADNRVVDVSPAVEDAFERSQAVAVEIALDPDNPNPFVGMTPEAVRGLLLTAPEHRIAQLLAPADVAALKVAGAAYGFPSELVDAFRPSVLATFMAIPVCVGRMGIGATLDGRITRRARDEHKTLTGLETIAEQIEAVRDVPDADQAQLILSAVRHLPESENMFETVLALYARGEIGEMLAWARSPRPVPSIDAPVPPSFYEALLDRRNPRMVERAMPLVAAGGVFIAVGAAHLPGEGGFVRRFEKAGYVVTTVE